MAGGRSLHPIFKDREEEAAGASIGAAIEAALSQSEFLIVLCSPRSAQSKWVNREVAWFKTHRDPKKILTLIVGGEPGASAISGRETEECFPKALLFKVAPDDLQPTDEAEDAPLAADARESGDGRRGAKLKLAAALLGVGLDELVKRDDRRRSARRRAAMSAMAASIAVLAGITFYAIVQRNEAVAAQAKAEAAEKDAKFQADKAQDLVEFMLTDLRERLNAVGRLDILETVAARLLESYAKDDLAKLDANALGRRARVLLLLGEVDNTRGNLDAALARYKEASATTEELLRRNPESAQQIFDHAQSAYWVGYIAWQRGDAVLAKKQFTQYYELAQRLIAIDPDKDEWRMEVGYAVNNLGVLAMDQGEAAGAEIAFRQYLEVTSRLATANTRDVQRQIEVGQAYAWLADSLLRQSKIYQALEQRRAEIDVYEEALLTQKGSMALGERLAVAQYSVALLELSAGNPQHALTFASAGANLAEELLALEPSSAQLADRTAFAHAVLGEAQMHVGAIADARRSLARSLALSDSLVEREASVSEWKFITTMDAKLLDARLEAAAGEASRAVAKFSVVEAALRPVVATNTAEPSIVRRYCAALAGRARLDASYAADWLDVANRLSRLGQAGPESLALLAEAYHRTGRITQAAASIAALYAAGYRQPDFMALLEEFPELKAAAAEAAVANAQ